MPVEYGTVPGLATSKCLCAFIVSNKGGLAISFIFWSQGSECFCSVLARVTPWWYLQCVYPMWCKLILDPVLRMDVRFTPLPTSAIKAKVGTMHNATPPLTLPSNDAWHMRVDFAGLGAERQLTSKLCTASYVSEVRNSSCAEEEEAPLCVTSAQPCFYKTSVAEKWSQKLQVLKQMAAKRINLLSPCVKCPTSQQE